MRLKLELAAMVGAAALAACNKPATEGAEEPTAVAPGSSFFADSCERLEGVWRNGDRLYRIRKDGSVYSISGHGQSFAGPCADAIISTGTFVGNVTYLQSADRMLFAGEQYFRSSEEEEARRIADLQAAEIARQQARQAEEEAAQQRYAEKQRLEAIRIHLVNCWNNGVQCDDLAAEARAYPEDVENAKQAFFSEHDITAARIAEREQRLGPLPGKR